jgi:hypothetical protein
MGSDFDLHPLDLAAELITAVGQEHVENVEVPLRRKRARRAAD